jgi:hypothetical protein
MSANSMLKDKKVLCIGNESEQTNRYVNLLAQKNKSRNLGLITQNQLLVDSVGFYHTSLADIDILDLEKFILNFDYVIYIKQPKNSYSDEELYLTTEHMIVFIEKRLKIPMHTENLTNEQK